MAAGERALLQHVPDGLGQRQKAQQVRHGAAAAAQALGGGLLRQAALLHQPVHAGRFLDGVEVVALKVLHQCGLQAAHLVPVAHDGGDLGQSRQTRRAPPAFARDDDIAPAGFVHQDRLDHAHRFDRRGQFVQRILAEAAARLIAVGIDFVQAQAHHRVG